MCDCRDNPYQRLSAAVLPERGFVCFGSTGVRTSSPRGLFPSANNPPEKRQKTKKEMVVFSCLFCVKLTNNRSCGCGPDTACKPGRAYVMLQIALGFFFFSLNVV